MSEMSDRPTEFHEGEWVHPTVDGPAPWAVVSFDATRRRWMWWALGWMGDEATYEAACGEAVESLYRTSGKGFT